MVIEKITQIHVNQCYMCIHVTWKN